MLGAVFIITAISLIPLSTVSAIFQAIPLLVTFGAALIFRETVGWRRWAAVFVGFTGVIIMLRPTPEAIKILAIIPIVAAFFVLYAMLRHAASVPQNPPLQSCFGRTHSY